MKEKAKLFILAFFSLFIILCIFHTKTLAAQNENDTLLINGDAESTEMSGWVDQDDCWSEQPYGSAKQGNGNFWPAKKDLEHTFIYQDVNISNYAKGTWMQLSAWMANYDQSPHDQASLILQFLDSKGKVLLGRGQSQRNPKWIHHVITAQIPQNAVTARVILDARRYVGSDNDAYFDVVKLVVLKQKQKLVYISGKKATAASGETFKLTANNGTTTKASKFSWFSSYDALATVNKDGVVTVHDDSSEVVIYAKDKSTGITGSYSINSNNANLTPSPKKVTGLKLYKASRNTITIKWNTSKDADGYTVYQYNKKSHRYKKIKTITKSSITIATLTGLSEKTNYKFKVTAYNTYGSMKYSSKASTILTAKTK